MSLKSLSPILLTLALSACGGGAMTSVSPGDAYPARAGINQQDIEVLLQEHNRVRADVGVGGLKWSPQLATYAQAWADHLADTTCYLEHRPRKGKWKQRYGENLFMGTAGFYSVREAVRSWESEKKDYRYGTFTGKNLSAIGHYTQIIWANTTMVGCGQALCRSQLIVACNYDPPGNYLGQKPY